MVHKKKLEIRTNLLIGKVEKMPYGRFFKRTKEQTLPEAPALQPLHNCLDENVEKLKIALGDSSDLFIRFIHSPHNEKIKIAVLHLDGLADDAIVNEHVINPLIQWANATKEANSLELEESVKGNLAVSQLTIKEDWDSFLSAVVSGDAVVLLDGCSKLFITNTQKLQSRAITEPTTQTVVKGPKDCFTESLRTNTSLIRAKIQNPCLRLKSMKIGKVTQTEVAIMYIEGIVDKAIQQEVEKRLKRIDVNSILESNYIEEFIKDDSKTIFPLVLSTERPDAVVGNLLEGRVAVIIQGTPYVLITPVVFSQFFQSPEDYYQNYYISSFIRLLRFVAFFLSMYVSSIYLALITHHHGLIPTTLLVSLMAQREIVPFPAIVEIILMELAFETLREAGIRMPRAIGPAVSIVGALILGQAAVDAGFVSAAVVIIVAISSISSFTLPNISISSVARGFRFMLILAASFIGLYGILLVTLCIWLHMSTLRSFGILYFNPFAPFNLQKQKDGLLRFPLPFLLKKPNKPKPIK